MNFAIDGPPLSAASVGSQPASTSHNLHPSCTSAESSTHSLESKSTSNFTHCIEATMNLSSEVHHGGNCSTSSSPISILPKQLVLQHAQLGCGASQELPTIFKAKCLIPSSSPTGTAIQQRHGIAKSLSLPSLGSSPSRRRRRWSSGPSTFMRERKLQLRRSICESGVKRLYDDRKDNILEIFEDQWLISDDLDDYE